MKKCLALLLVLVMLISACGCKKNDNTVYNSDTAPAPSAYVDTTGYTVNSPMAYPDYVFEKDPYNLELRMMAVQAMRDILSIQWSTAQPIAYYKDGPVSDKHFQHAADVTYSGVLYSSANAGIFQFMEFYDQKTGRLKYPGTADELKLDLGSSCADALIWSWNTVCTSIQGPYYPSTMVYKNGYYPVGDYTYDFEGTSNFILNPTYNIIKANGRDVIIDAYTKMLPADALVSTSDNHAMMVIGYPHIEYNEDGSVNTAKSYVMIQDQRGGTGSGFYEVQKNGETLLFSGRLEAKFTFDELYKKNYIPVTTAEFAGLKEYERANVTVTGSYGTFEELLQAQLNCNYPFAVVNAYLVYPDGGQVLIDRELFSGADKGGVPRTYALSKMSILSTGAFRDSLKANNTYTLRIEVVASNGERFVPIELTIST